MIAGVGLVDLLKARAADRVAKAQDAFDVTRGGIDDLEARVAAADGPDRAALEERLARARAERERLLAAHRAGPKPPADDWRDEEWATVGVVRGVDALLGMQGDHPVEAALLEGRPVATMRVRDGSNVNVRVELDNGQVGFFKSFSGLDQNLAEDFGQDEAFQPVHEVAAWQLAKRLGEPWSHMVATCVVREVDGELGSFSADVGGRPRQDFHDSPEWRSAAFYDALVGQQDRHQSNYHMDGENLRLFDHGYCFSRAGEYVNCSALQSGRAGERITDMEYEALDRVIASPDLLGLRQVLEGDRADALLDRAEAMFDRGEIPGPSIAS